MRALQVGLAVWMVFGSTIVARGGECTEEEATRVAELEKVIAGKATLEDTEVNCLYLTRIGDYPNWAGPHAAKALAALKSDKLNGRIVKDCATVMARHDVALKRVCIGILATRGIRRIVGKNLYDLEPLYSERGFSPTQLAALGGPEAGERIAKRFGQCKFMQYVDSPCTTNTPKTRQRDRYKRLDYRDYKFNQLNVLWHVGTSAEVPFLKRVANDDPDPEVRKRALKVLTKVETARVGSPGVR